MSVKEALKNLEWENVSDILVWFMYAVGIGFLPILAGLFLVKIPFAHFTSNGDITVYSLGLLSGTIYTLTRNNKPRVFISSGKPKVVIPDRRFPASTILIAITFLIALVSILLFSLALSDSSTYGNDLHTISIVVLSVAIPLSLFVELLNNGFNTHVLEVEQSRKKDRSNLGKRFTIAKGR